MITADAFREQPVLTGNRVQLEPMDDRHFDGILNTLSDPECMRLTGTRRSFTVEEIRLWVSTRCLSSCLKQVFD